MRELSLLLDAPFLRQLDLEKIKVYFVKIIILTRDEIPVRAIEGRVSTGSLSINGNSSMRRAGSITFLAEEKENDLTDVDNLLSMNRKIKILIGFENHIDSNYDDIIWFNQGIFVITQPNLQHTLSGVNISLSFKDKMCLLNGECGGSLPASVTFHEYDQIIGYDDNGGTYYNDYPLNPNNYTVYRVRHENIADPSSPIIRYEMWNATTGWDESSYDMVGQIQSIPQTMYDIIVTLVCNFGNENLSNMIINDLPHQVKSSVRYIGSNSLYFNPETSQYTIYEDETFDTLEQWVTYNYNEDCGYVYTDFTYPGQLVSSIGENICSVLDKIISVLGNYEYFYDVDGHFVFQEKKNYLNTSYEVIPKSDVVDPNTSTVISESLDHRRNLLDGSNYLVNFSKMNQSIYTFDEGSALISSYSNTPNYTNIKNDFHVWGKNEDGLAIHYHLAIKQKPSVLSNWRVQFEISEGAFTGRIVKIVDSNTTGEGIYDYQTNDWRAELYLQGLQKKLNQQRPDIYEQELLDLFDSIYEFGYYDANNNWIPQGRFKADITNNPNDLLYWFDYINTDLLFDRAVDVVGSRIMSMQKDKIIKLYNVDIPDLILIDLNAPAISQASISNKCGAEGQAFSLVSHSVYNSLAIGTVGYTAQETARELLYQNTDYNASISITSIPIYYLDVNSRITVNDKASGISGDYIINSINLPLDAKSTMTISASQVIDRV